MKRVLKWIGIGLGGLLGLLVVAVAVMAFLGGRKLNREYAVQPEVVVVEADTAVLERGQYLAATGCMGCHGENLGGTPFLDDPALGSLPAPNLTRGQGGAAAVYSDADFVRAIRHGIDSEGKPLIVMPSAAFWHYSDADLGAIIAYLQSVPPVDNNLGDKALGLMGRALVGAGVLDVLAVEKIDHTAPRPAAPVQQVDATYGEYLVNTSDCRSCHGPALIGDRSAEPGAPAAPSLTPDGNLANWSADDFIVTFRTGRTPDDRTLNPAFMPWQHYGRMTDADLTALFLYLQSLSDTVVAE
jgi:mono/diheme cytochrome c family protein